MKIRSHLRRAEPRANEACGTVYAMTTPLYDATSTYGQTKNQMNPFAALQAPPTKSPRHANAVAASGSAVLATSTNFPAVSHFTNRKTSDPDSSPPAKQNT